MSVNPLDLQTNFAKMNIIGRREVQIKEQEVLRQEHASEKMNKKGLQESNDVPNAKKTSEEKQKINDKEHNKRKRQKHNGENDEEYDYDDQQEEDYTTEENETDEDMKEEELHEEGIGNKIDLIG